MPTPMAMPPRLIMFKVRSNTFMSTKTDRIHTGMEMAMVMVASGRRRKRNTTIAASTTPKTIFWMADSTAMLM